MTCFIIKHCSYVILTYILVVLLAVNKMCQCRSGVNL